MPALSSAFLLDNVYTHMPQTEDTSESYTHHPALPALSSVWHVIFLLDNVFTHLLIIHIYHIHRHTHKQDMKVLQQLLMNMFFSRPTCARVTVVVLCVCLSVCYHSSCFSVCLHLQRIDCLPGFRLVTNHP